MFFSRLVTMYWRFKKDFPNLSEEEDDYDDPSLVEFINDFEQLREEILTGNGWILVQSQQGNNYPIEYFYGTETTMPKTIGILAYCTSAKEKKILEIYSHVF